MRFLLALLIMFTVGCTTASKQEAPPIKSVNMDQEAGVYLRFFRQAAIMRGLSLNYETLRVYKVDRFPWSDINDYTIGVCLRKAEKHVILIKEEYWDRADSVSREMLMFHELGHCILDLPHNLATRPNGDPVSLMYPTIFESSTYYDNHEPYLDELFRSALIRLQLGDLADEIPNIHITIDPKKFDKLKEKRPEVFRKLTR